MKWNIFLPYLLVTAGVTYLIRMLPFVLCKRRIANRFVRSFLMYMPYAVLGAMTFPAILYATGSLPTACAGLAVALILSFCERSLLTVAIGACLATLAATGVMMFITSR